MFAVYDIIIFIESKFIEKLIYLPRHIGVSWGLDDEPVSNSGGMSHAYCFSCDVGVGSAGMQ